MILNKKAFSATLKGLIIMLIIIGLVAFIVPREVWFGVSQVEYESCKKTHDYDGDGEKWYDECPCDYGGFEESKYYRLEGAPGCVLEMFEASDKTKMYKRSDLSSDSENECAKAYKDAVMAAGNPQECGGDEKKAMKDGFNHACAKEILQEDIGIEGGFAKVCATPDNDCKKKLVSYCRRNPPSSLT
ncbi:hypothetical protein AYK26_01835 [Euryarchaeota archaeon SM23-78]|nr:MAG: hypothetical protein AYK26_01835 [Euryarchaeota archaeon SM23-78]MBW3000342.1 hypothetical protein [Candidatus Woesearchaeota archaeon]